MVPVLTAHYEQLLKYTTEPTHEGDPLIDAMAWLAAGVECKIEPEPSGSDLFGKEWQRPSPPVGALFVLYYGLVQFKDELHNHFFTSLASEMNQRKRTFQGELWNGYSPHDIVSRIMQEPQPGDYLVQLMRDCVSKKREHRRSRLP